MELPDTQELNPSAGRGHGRPVRDLTGGHPVMEERWSGDGQEINNLSPELGPSSCGLGTHVKSTVGIYY